MISHKSLHDESIDFLSYIVNNDFKKIESILLEGSFDPTFNKNNAISFACLQGKFKIFELLLNDPRIDPSDYYQNTLVSVCHSFSFKNEFTKDHINILKSLLNDPRIDPTNSSSEAFFSTVKYNNVKAFKLFIEDGRANFS